MNDFRMNTFLMVCKLMNYTHAAQALHITQPAVSQHIRFLEEHYGVKLFHYEGKQLQLTGAGQTLKRAAQTMKQDERILRDLLHMDDSNKLVFGATLTIGDYVLPDNLIGFLSRDPAAEVRMLVDNTETLLQKIDSGELDFAVIEGYFRKSEYDYKTISRQPYIAVCGSSYVFHETPNVMSDLFGERVILREPGSGTREILERYLEEQNCSAWDFRQMTEIGSIRAIKTLVEAGFGITFIYEAAVAEELKQGVLRRIPLSDFEKFNNFSMVWRKNSMFQEKYLRIFNQFFGAQA